MSLGDSPAFERRAGSQLYDEGMRTIKCELAHVGMFGSDGPVVTKQGLADVVDDTFDGKGPVTLSHKLADWMPKFGNTTHVELDASGDSLFRRFRDQRHSLRRRRREVLRGPLDRHEAAGLGWQALSASRCLTRDA